MLTRAQGVRTKTVVVAPAEPETAVEPVAAEPPQGVTTHALKRGQCSWPLNDGRPEWRHCGAPAKGPYCPAHKARSYSKSHRDVV